MVPASLYKGLHLIILSCLLITLSQCNHGKIERKEGPLFDARFIDSIQKAVTFKLLNKNDNICLYGFLGPLMDSSSATLDFRDVALSINDGCYEYGLSLLPHARNILYTKRSGRTYYKIIVPISNTESFFFLITQYLYRCFSNNEPECFRTATPYLYPDKANLYDVAELDGFFSSDRGDSNSVIVDNSRIRYYDSLMFIYPKWGLMRLLRAEMIYRREKNLSYYLSQMDTLILLNFCPEYALRQKMAEVYFHDPYGRKSNELMSMSNLYMNKFKTFNLIIPRIFTENKRFTDAICYANGNNFKDNEYVMCFNVVSILEAHLHLNMTKECNRELEVIYKYASEKCCNDFSDWAWASYYDYRFQLWFVQRNYGKIIQDRCKQKQPNYLFTETFCSNDNEFRSTMRLYYNSFINKDTSDFNKFYNSNF